MATTYSTVDVRLLIALIDGSAGEEGGTLTIAPDVPGPLFVSDPDYPLALAHFPVRVPIRRVEHLDGYSPQPYLYASVTVPASDAVELVAGGFTYTATATLADGRQLGKWTFATTLTPPVLWLSEAAAVTPTPGEALPQITRAEHDDVATRVASLEGAPVMIVLNSDGTWPPIPLPTAARPVLLFDDPTAVPLMTRLPDPPLGAQTRYLRKIGGRPFESEA